MSFTHNKQTILLIMIALTLCVIWGNSMLPATLSAELSGGVRSWIDSLLGVTGGGLEGDGGLRKAAHFMEFAVLGVEMAVLFASTNRTGNLAPADGLEKTPVRFSFSTLFARKALLVFSGFSVAVVDETIQLFSDGRAGMVQDVWIDFLGFLTGTGVVWVFMRLRSYQNKRGRKRDV